MSDGSANMGVSHATAPALRAELRCIECGETYALHSVVYRCKSCDGLLEVAHDEAAITARSADEWRLLFESRFRAGPAPYDSGVWGKQEWVLPELAEEHIVSLGEGATPLVALRRLGQAVDLPGLYIKQCGTSHSGSFKDLGMTVLVSHVVALRARGLPIKAVVCASTGDTSAALAAYGAAAGVPSIVLLPAGKISTAQLMQPLANGSIVVNLDTDFDGCMRVVREITKDDSLYLANSMNPLRIEGQKTISVEIVQQLGWTVPDWVVIPGGNLGNVSALGAGFKLLRAAGLIDRLPRIALAQAQRANPMVRSFREGYAPLEPIQAGATLASAIRIGNPVSFPRAVRTLREFEGVAEEASESELADAAAFADLYGTFADPHTGVALAAAFKLRQKNVIGRDERVVVISTAHGLKFQNFKTDYHEGKFDFAVRHANGFVAAPEDADRVRAIIHEEIARRLDHV